MNATPSDLEREAIRAALHAIVEGNHGVLNPHAVLEVARDPKHLLHPWFDWDDHAAAEQYRLVQVGVLIRRVRFNVVRADATTREIAITTTRGYQSLPSMRTASGGYERIDRILANAEKRAELLAQVVRELRAYRKRYAELSELQAIWIAVDDATTEIIEASPTVPADSGESRPGAAG